MSERFNFSLFASSNFQTILFMKNTEKNINNKSNLHQADFDRIIEGKQVELYILTNSKGMEVAVTNYGCMILSIMVPDKDGKYAKYVDSILKNGKENMILDPAIMVGAAAIAIVAFTIIPLTRKLIYCFKELRRKLSNTLAEQAYFLELNKNCLEYNTTMDEKKKQKILKRQEKLRNVLLSLSDKIKIDDVKAQQQSSREMQRDNKEMTIDGIRDEISDSDITIV